MRKPGASERYDDMNAEEARTTAFYDPWEEAPPVDFPGGVFTRKVEDTLFALALRSGTCPAALSMAHLAVVSGAAHKGSRFQPYANDPAYPDDPTWTVPPVIWVMPIQESGQRKTAALDLASPPLREIDTNTWSSHFSDLRRWKSLPAKERKETNPPDEPTPLIVEDITIEKLQQCLGNTDRGLFYLRDEIAGLFEFGRYSKGNGAAERGFYLQSFEGGPYTVLRVGREPVFVSNNALTIYGAIQPERLNRTSWLHDTQVAELIANSAW
jgi:hypothetical protein